MAAERSWARYKRSAAQGLSFRRMVERDLSFLEELYTSTREDELALTHWSVEERHAFLSAQFQAQHTHYMEHYPDADWLIIKSQRRRIGRLYLERWPTQHRIIDIALLPVWRGKGFGAALLEDIIDEANDAEKSVSIHVEKNNPAKRLYERLGFAVSEDKGVYDLMVRPARPCSRSAESMNMV